MAADVDLDVLDLAAQGAGGHVDIDFAGLDAGVALGLVDSGADRRFGLLHVGDEAAADALADPLTDTDDARVGALARAARPTSAISAATFDVPTSSTVIVRSPRAVGRGALGDVISPPPHRWRTAVPAWRAQAEPWPAP